MYTFKKEFQDKPDSRTNAPNELEGIIEKFNKELKDNKTVGDNGSYTIDGKTEKPVISFTINIETFKFKLDEQKINWEESYKQRKKVSTASTTDVENFKLEVLSQALFNSRDKTLVNGTEKTVYNYFKF